MKRTILHAAVLLTALTSFAQAQHGHDSSHAASESSGDTKVPDGKETTLGLYVTAAEAHAKWKADPKHVKIIDVRTPEEYCFVGHPTVAWNVPLKLLSKTGEIDNKGPAMSPNEAFVQRVKAIAKSTDTVLLTCRSGHRSAAAVDLLAKAGLKNVYSIVDGFEGDKVARPDSPRHGKREVNGWKNAMLPWTYDLNPKLLYSVQPPEKN